MKKTVWKTSIAKVMAAIMVFSLVGCEKKSKQDNTDTLEMAYEGTALVVDGMEGDPVSCCVRDGKIYILTECSAKGDSTKEPNEHMRLYSAHSDGSHVQRIPINLSEEETIHTFLVEKDGTLLCLMAYGDEEPYNELVRYDADGRELLRENITKSLNLSVAAGVSGIAEDGNGKVVVADDRRVYILNKELQPVGEVEAEKWGDSLRPDAGSYTGSDLIMDGSEYDFYYRDSFGIYGYDMADKKGTKLLDYAASYLTSEDADSMVSTGDGGFLGIAYDHTQNRSVLEVYSKADPAGVAGRQTITYAAYGVSDATKRAAMEFNQKNKDYKIEFKDYTDEEDPSAKMLTDIMAGNVPDIISISILPISAEQCVEKGLLEDLTPYYEKDPLVQMDDIIHSVWEAMKIDGKLYYVTPYFSIKSIVGKTKDVGTGSGWTLDELKALLDKKGEGVIPFDTESKADMLSDFLSNGITDFVDWQTG
ncbi:MAG: extracellular solute-binding protein, partial [Lachnospiraceae bacterium]|nr:extracellular solute-binding protein [Lachnospiraceae bacterium]